MKAEPIFKNQVLALARPYMQTNCAGFFDKQGRINDILRMADEYQVDAIVDYSLLFCRLYSKASYLLKQALQEKSISLHVERAYRQEDMESCQVYLTPRGYLVKLGVR